MTTAGLQFHLDAPGSWRLASRVVQARGWAFDRHGLPLLRVQLRHAGGTLEGTVGLSRPDVRAALPAARADETGFEIHGLLPPGHYEVGLALQCADGSWQEPLTVAADVPARRLPLWLGPVSWEELVLGVFPTRAATPPRPLQPPPFPRADNSAPAPRLVIVTPSFNHAAFLAETARSVLDQVDVDCVYGIHDGGSTDATPAVLAEIAARDPAGRLVFQESRRDDGQADAIARGFARIPGRPDDVMAWINSDDFYLPGALGFIAAWFARHPAVDVVYGDRVLVDAASREIGRWELPAHDDEVLRWYDFVPQETLFWRRRIWDLVGGVDPRLRFALDWDLLLRFQSAGARIVHLPHALACFRLHPAQKTAAQRGVGEAEIAALRARTFGREVSPSEIAAHPRLRRYLRRAALLADWRRFRHR